MERLWLSYRVIDQNFSAGLGERREPGLAEEEGADRGAVTARRVRGDLQLFPHAPCGGCRVVVLQEAAPEQPHPTLPHPVYEHAALGQRPFVARPGEQVPPAGSPVGPRRTEVGDPAEPHAVGDGEAVLRDVDDGRPGGQVDEGEEADGVGVGCQEQRVRVHELGEQQHVTVGDSRVGHRPPHRPQRHRGQPRRIRLDPVHPVQLPVHGLGRLHRRQPVLEEERAGRGLRRVRCGQGGGNGIVVGHG